MSSNIISPSKQKDSGGNTSSPGLKTKAKAKEQVAHQEGDDDNDDDDDDDEDEDDDDEDMESDDGEDEDQLDKIDHSLPRTRGIRVNYTSKEALEKAGLKEEDDDEDNDEDAEMK